MSCGLWPSLVCSGRLQWHLACNSGRTFCGDAAFCSEFGGCHKATNRYCRGPKHTSIMVLWSHFPSIDIVSVTSNSLQYAIGKYTGLYMEAAAWTSQVLVDLLMLALYRQLPTLRHLPHLRHYYSVTETPHHKKVKTLSHAQLEEEKRKYREQKLSKIIQDEEEDDAK